MNMGRPRNKKNNKYPEGFYPASNKHGCRMIHPITGKLEALKTRDIEEGLHRFGAISDHFSGEKRQDIVNNASYNMHTPKLAAKSKEYRTTQLVLTVSKRGASKGEKLNADTIKSYTNHYKYLEAQAFSNNRIGVFNDPTQGVTLARQYLARWSEKPRTYNYRLSTLSRLFEHLVSMGDLVRNPCRDISNQVVPKRQIYVPDDHYIEIMRGMSKEHNVYPRACDWLYLMSGRNSNTLAIKEADITPDEILFHAEKNRRYGAMKRDPDLNRLIDWFRAYKRKAGILSPELIVHPLCLEPSETRKKRHKVRNQIAARPITNEHLYRRFVSACAAVGLSEYGYTLRDLRPKGLTEEAANRGQKSNKGLHSESMQSYYVKLAVPESVDNTLKLIPWDK